MQGRCSERGSARGAHGRPAAHPAGREHDLLRLGGRFSSLGTPVLAQTTSQGPKIMKLLEAECCGQAPLLGTLWAAMIVWLVRLVAIFLGSWLGAYMGGSTVDHRRRIWQGMITQVCRLCTVQLHSAVLGRNAKI